MPSLIAKKMLNSVLNSVTQVGFPAESTSRLIERRIVFLMYEAVRRQKAMKKGNYFPTGRNYAGPSIPKNEQTMKVVYTMKKEFYSVEIGNCNSDLILI